MVRLNTERAPSWRLALHPTEGWSANRGVRTITSDECAGVWWRQPEAPTPPGAVTAAAAMIADQWRVFIAALAHADGPTWISRPATIRAAEDKALQLKCASKTGLSIPETLWTNDASEAYTFVQRWQGRAVAKSVTSAWWEDSGGGHFVYATLVTTNDLPRPQRLATAPVCFQQPVWPKRDIRVTVVARSAFGAIRNGASDPDEPLDWRRSTEAQWAPYDLPAHVANACCSLVREFNLNFAGIDLALDAAGEHWFLELNPNGEWGWLQRAGLPIAESLADLLLN